MSVGDESPVRVLYVDGDGEQAREVKDALESLSETFSVTTVENGKPALELLGEEGFDCVVSDYDLPDLNGDAFLNMLAEYEDRLPFVLFTERGSEEVVSGDISVRVTNYLRKGTDADQYVMLANRITNVVEKRRTEEALEDLKERYELVARTSSDAFWDWDLETGVVDHSDGFTTIFGYPEEDIDETYDWWIEHVHPDDRQAVQAYGRAVFESNLESYKDEYRFQRADGTYAHILARARAVYDDDGDPLRMVGSLTDITPLKARSEELERSRQQLRAIVDNFPDGAVFLYDHDLRYLIAGGEALEHVGACPELFEGEQFPIMGDEELIEKQRRMYESALAGEAVEWEDEYDGGVFHLQALPVYDDDGEVFAGMLVVRDITERKRYERELERQNERLKSFAAVLSHDLRNPLSVARGYLDLARSEGDSEYLEAIATAQKRMDEIIEDVLALAREGEAVEETTPVSLAEQCEACWTNIVSENATLEVTDDLRFEADGRRLNHLLENLFRNAVEHGSTDDRVTVTVGLLADSDGFFVEDDGPGIPEDTLDRVFEAGFSTNTEGTGLGLSIVAEIAGSHGWQVAATGADSGGARFEIRGVTPVQ